MIPKAIHQIWLGPRPRPTAMMESWRKNHPGWSYHVWTEEMIDYPLHNQAQYDAMKDFCGKADVLRYEILNRHGGIYVDADMTSLRPLDPDMLEHELFAAYENERFHPGLVANGIIGCTPGHPVMEQMIERIHTLDPRRLRQVNYAVETGPFPLTEIIESYQGAVAIYPSRLFFPEHYSSAFRSDAEGAFARHDWFFGYPTTCLTMMIERDTANIWRCLPRIKPHICSYRIGLRVRDAPESCQAIDAVLGDLPGEIVDIQETNPGQAWTTILRAVDGLADFALLADPDTTIYDFRRNMLRGDVDCYEINVHHNAVKRPAVQLVQADGRWCFSNHPPHSVERVEFGTRRGRLEGCHLRKLDSRLPDSKGMMDELALLLDELDGSPGDPEPLFYLGQYYEDVGEPARAAHFYERRATAGGWKEQAWEACWRIARCLRMADAPWATIEKALENAHRMDPTRPEPLFSLGANARLRGDHDQAFEFLSLAADLPVPERYFYWDPRIRQQVLEELCICAYHAGRFPEGLRAGLEALQTDMTIMSRDQIIRNIGFYLDKVEIHSRA